MKEEQEERRHDGKNERTGETSSNTQKKVQRC